MLLSAAKIFAATKLLVDFGADEASCVFGSDYPSWNQVLYHSTAAVFVDPDGDPTHQGLAESQSLTDYKTAYFGVKGTSAISLRKGDKVLATFYNTSSNTQSFEARISFTDENEPFSYSTATAWFTMDKKPPDYSSVYTVPSHSFITMEYYIRDSSMTSHRAGLVSEGDYTVVSISLPHEWITTPYGTFVLTKIEISDEADITKPAAPSNLQARAKILSSSAGATAIELTWSPSTDPGANATGISHYLIYRNGELWSTIVESIVNANAGDFTYIDLNVLPGVNYYYQVSAVDKAPFGQYPKTDNMNYRISNESILTAPVYFSAPTGNINEAQLVNPTLDIQYLGAFRLPDNNNDSGWAFAMHGLTYYPDGNANYDSASELPGSLYGYGNVNQMMISEINIPKPVISGNVNDLFRARTLKPFMYLWPKVYTCNDVLTDTPCGGAGKLPGLVYVPEKNGVPGALYYVLHNWYSPVLTDPILGYFDLALTEGTGAWKISTDGINPVSPGLCGRFAFLIPQEYADANFSGRSLIVGNSGVSGLGVPSNGPSLYAIAPWAQGIWPPVSQMVPATTLLKYDAGYAALNRVVDSVGTCHGAAWISTKSGKQAVCLSDDASFGELWYGDDAGSYLANFDLPPKIAGNKGGGRSFIRSGLVFYNPNDFAKVADGQLKSGEVQPYLKYDLSQFMAKGLSGAITFDPDRGYLYFISENGDPGYVYGRSLIHIFKIEDNCYGNIPPGPPSGLEIR